MNTQTQTRTILVVDDDKELLEDYSIMFTDLGYRVITAQSQAQAEKRIDEGGFDVAVLDLLLEHADSGFTLCYHIKKRYPAIPVIVVTGVFTETGIEFDSSTEEERSWLKADALLTKPVRIEQLHKLIDQLTAS